MPNSGAKGLNVLYLIQRNRDFAIKKKISEGMSSIVG
jgi:hypothetical protein